MIQNTPKNAGSAPLRRHLPRGVVRVASFPVGKKGDESTFEATVELTEGSALLVPGMHAEVDLGRGQ